MTDISSSQNGEIPLLTFNSLYNILREEKKNKLLQKLPNSFYESLDNFFESKKKEIEKLKKEAQKDKLKKERHVYNNSIKIAKEFISLRCQKISNIAINNAIFDEDSMSKKEILGTEDNFFSKVLDASSKMKKERLKQ